MRARGLFLFAAAMILMGGQAATAAEPASATVALQQYVDCGCGCCGGTEPTDKCLYKSKGDSIENVIGRSKKNPPSEHTCAVAGCSKGVRYRYCD